MRRSHLYLWPWLSSVALAIPNLTCFGSNDQVCAATIANNSTSLRVYVLVSAESGWGAIGVGPSMVDSTMYMIYKHPTAPGMVYTSPRIATGHVVPQPDEKAREAVSILESGVRPRDDRFGVIMDIDTTKIDRTVKLETQNDFIWAFGEDVPSIDANNNTVFSGHQTAARGRFAMKPSDPFALINRSSLDYPVVVHGSLMLASWLVLTPAAIYSSRYMKSAIPVQWFRIHVSLVLLSAVCTFTAFAFIWGFAEGRHFQAAHSILGLAILIFMQVQILLGFVIDRLFKSARNLVPIRDRVHWWLGRCVLLAGIVNILLGIFLIDLNLPFIIVTCILFAMAGLALAYGQYNHGQRDKRRSLDNEPSNRRPAKSIIGGFSSTFGGYDTRYHTPPRPPPPERSVALSTYSTQ